MVRQQNKKKAKDQKLMSSKSTTSQMSKSGSRVDGKGAPPNMPPKKNMFSGTSQKSNDLGLDSDDFSSSSEDSDDDSETETDIETESATEEDRKARA